MLVDGCFPFRAVRAGQDGFALAIGVIVSASAPMQGLSRDAYLMIRLAVPFRKLESPPKRFRQRYSSEVFQLRDGRRIRMQSLFVQKAQAAPRG
jgi:hypothetical protein